MLNVVRYINGKKVNKEDLPKYEIDNESVLKIIRAANERVQNARKISPRDNCSQKVVEKVKHNML